MDTKNPVTQNARSEPEAGAPVPLQVNTPDPHEATKPVRIVLDTSATRSENAQAAPAPARDLEDTKPIQIRAGVERTALSQTSEPDSTLMEELPAWLIAFAREETLGETPVNPDEDTRTIPLQPTEEQTDAEASGIASLAPTAQAADTDNGWKVESPPESLVDDTGIESSLEPVVPEHETDQAEDLPEVQVSHVEETSPEPSESAEVSVEPIASGSETAPEDSQYLNLTTALDEGRYADAGEILSEMKSDPAARASALRLLRSRLDLRAESQPLWEFYADLCSADDQPGLARQAQETSEKLKNISGDEHGTIPGIG